MKTILQLTIISLAITSLSYGQANTTLSNLASPTAVNQNLIPNNNNGRDLGSPVKSWRSIYLDSNVYLRDVRFMHNTGTQNAFAGDGAGNSITKGKNNAAFGYHALYADKAQSFNSAFGSLALANNTAANNSALGYNALGKNTTGADNAAVGFSALYSNTTAGSNTAVGSSALYKNGIGANVSLDEGTRNTAVGASSMYSNTTGLYNTAVGTSSLYANTSGYFNTALGLNALLNNIDGHDNTATGLIALAANQSGNFNTATGSRALQANTTGNNNVANGVNALYYNTTGYSNVGIGIAALYNNTTEHNQVAIGDSALFNFNFNSVDFAAGNTAMGSKALYYTTTGTGNTATGFYALQFNTTGSFNTAIGEFADAYTAGLNGNLTNATAIGSLAIADASNKVRIGDNSVTSIGGIVGWSNFSDGRYKKDIKQDVQGLAFINSLQPVTYTIDINGLNEYCDKGRKRDSSYEKMKAGMKESAEKAAKIIYNGFIAQDVEKAAEKLHYNFSGVDKPQTKEGLYGLRYADFVVPLVKAVQELSKMNDAKDSAIQQQNIKISDLQNQINELKALVISSQQTINISSASVAQNIPNPFNHTTTINYSLPQTYSSAKIIVTDKSGKTLKEINVTAKGKGSVQLDASTLASGAYQYSLYIDGKLIDTKQMVLAK